MSFPEKYDPATYEEKWQRRWEDLKLYRWNPDVSREDSFVIDTPPPTVSGSLHIGHVFSYVHTDIIARYQRMNGKNIMYPMGFDDNGLPTERRVQNLLGIRCDPRIEYDPTVTHSNPDTGERVQSVSRRNFIEACSQVTVRDEKVFQDLWKHLGLSVDWNEEYATINRRCRFASQKSFLELMDKGLIYSVEAPTMWDVTFQTAVAQAELEDRMIAGHFHDIRFGLRDGGEFVISTTRPELIPACIAIAAHPTDHRYQHYFGKTAISPIFGIEIPILPSEHADPSKGAGIMMICTFGDSADLAWWRSSNLPVRTIVGRDGRFLPVDFNLEPFRSVDPSSAAQAYASLVGKKISQARSAMVAMLAATGSGPYGEGRALVGDPKPITHVVKFFEKGDLPVEFVTSRQWYCRILDHKNELLDVGRRIEWHPEHMQTRYEHWVNGLNSDWCISRQRFFGVPFPVWYRLDSEGGPNFNEPILPTADMLPIDPMSQPPPGFTHVQRGQPNGFVGDPDVMDTWATSSLTPLIVSGWAEEDPRHSKLFPMDLRPQSHEIIRTWAFYTIVKSWFHCGQAPWKKVAISGWILDPDRKKMSKSKGNVITPQDLLQKYSSDGVRYWSARARLGVDTAFDEKVMDSGRKLSVKLFNASKFVIQQFRDEEKSAFDPWADFQANELDRSWTNRLQDVIVQATESFERLDHARALNLVEELFWDFCDNYIELVKTRCYEGDPLDRRSALAALGWSIDCFTRLLAPFCPYICEETWWNFPWRRDSDISIHVATWPKGDEMNAHRAASDSRQYELAVQILNHIRKTKGDQKKGMRWPVERIEISAPADLHLSLQSLKSDIVNAGNLSGAGSFVLNGNDSAELRISVQLTEAPVT